MRGDEKVGGGRMWKDVRSTLEGISGVGVRSR